MSGILIDTNAYAAYLAGDKAVFEALTRADSVAVSVIVLGELHAGFWGGNKRAENERLLAQFLSKPRMESLFLTAETARIFGEIKAALRRAGTPIPINDVWLAAQAIETGRVVVTFDAHFRDVPGLRLWNA